MAYLQKSKNARLTFDLMKAEDLKAREVIHRYWSRRGDAYLRKYIRDSLAMLKFLKVANFYEMKYKDASIGVIDRELIQYIENLKAKHG